MKNGWIYMIVIFIALCSCKKAENRSCFKNAGNEKTEVISLKSIDSLFLYDNIIYTLIPDTITFLELSGGENLLNHIEYLDFDKKLVIRNNNKCNFLRSFKKKIKAAIHIQKINYIHYEGTEGLKNKDTLKSGELRLIIRDGAGPVDLTVKNSYQSAVITHGWGDFTLRGSSSSVFLNCNTNSFCNTVDLKVKNTLKVLSNTGGNMTVNSEGTNLEAIIKRDGNILYEGTPNTIDLDKTGDGMLIKLN